MSKRKSNRKSDRENKRQRESKRKREKQINVAIRSGSSSSLSKFGGERLPIKIARVYGGTRPVLWLGADESEGVAWISGKDTLTRLRDALNEALSPKSATITLEQARRKGMAHCECGHPHNNHFSHGTRPCAHCECKELRERITSP